LKELVQLARTRRTHTNILCTRTSNLIWNDVI